jgi:hypothetical protein
LTTIETLIEAATPILRRYSTWIGETLRSTAKLMSSGAPPSAPSRGTAS